MLRCMLVRVMSGPRRGKSRARARPMICVARCYYFCLAEALSPTLAPSALRHPMTFRKDRRRGGLSVSLSLRIFAGIAERSLAAHSRVREWSAEQRRGRERGREKGYTRQ